MILNTFNVGYTIWQFERLVSDELIKCIINESEMLSWGSLNGKRTDKNIRHWMHNYEHPCFWDLIEYFDSYETRKMFGETVGRDYTTDRLRIELCKDLKGSWLEDHCDDDAKTFTLQLYLDYQETSTTFNNLKTKAKRGSGWFFVNTGNEPHKLEPLQDDRISVIVNYVNDKWQDESVLV